MVLGLLIRALSRTTFKVNILVNTVQQRPVKTITVTAHLW